MTVVSSKEFATHHDKYLELAVSEEVFIQRGDYMFIVARATDRKIEHKKSDAKAPKLSDKFRGVFSKEVGMDFMNHTKVMREEWDSI